jgi:hypothetical protein
MNQLVTGLICNAVLASSCSLFVSPAVYRDKISTLFLFLPSKAWWASVSAGQGAGSPISLALVYCSMCCLSGSSENPGRVKL